MGEVRQPEKEKEGASCRSKTKPTKNPDRMEPSDAEYKCEPSGNQSATRGHHATVLGKGVIRQDKKSRKALFFMPVLIG